MQSWAVTVTLKLHSNWVPKGRPHCYAPLAVHHNSNILYEMEKHHEQYQSTTAQGPVKTIKNTSGTSTVNTCTVRLTPQSWCKYQRHKAIQRTNTSSLNSTVKGPLLQPSSNTRRALNRIYRCHGWQYQLLHKWKIPDNSKYSYTHKSHHLVHIVSTCTWRSAGRAKEPDLISQLGFPRTLTTWLDSSSKCEVDHVSSKKKSEEEMFWVGCKDLTQILISQI